MCILIFHMDEKGKFVHHTVADEYENDVKPVNLANLKLRLQAS